MKVLSANLSSSHYLGHIGSNDAELSSHHLTIIQSQMQSKGGYDINSLRLQVKPRHSIEPIHFYTFSSQFNFYLYFFLSSLIKAGMLMDINWLRREREGKEAVY